MRTSGQTLMGSRLENPDCSNFDEEELVVVASKIAVSAHLPTEILKVTGHAGPKKNGKIKQVVSKKKSKAKEEMA